MGCILIGRMAWWLGDWNVIGGRVCDWMVVGWWGSCVWWVRGYVIG